MKEAHSEREYSEKIAIWLFICAFCVLMMVFIGGVTRLTNSGLSMVEWYPVTGILPPITESSWLLEFAKYQSSPEYIHVNNGISLEEFKWIYFVEYFHRLFGRITGLVFMLPMLYFIITKQVKGRLLNSLAVILLFGFIQGLLGWYMVQSGLKDQPHVSHYRLALHLICASIIYSLIFWEALKQLPKLSKLIVSRFFKAWVVCVITCLIWQIFSGGLTAGLGAGKIYNSFPLMNGEIIPDDVWFYKPLYINLFENASMVQFIHRMGAYFIALNCFGLSYNLYSKNRFVSLVLLAIVSLQVLLGVITIIYSVPLVAASLHQINAILLLSILLYINFILEVSSPASSNPDCR